MITRLAISGYRSLRDVVIDLGQLTVVTGPNGSGKASLYRALRLLSYVAQGRIIGSLAAEGGLSSTLWAGPEKFSRAMKEARQRVEPLVGGGPVSLKLGFASEDYGYAIDLGMPIPVAGTRFHLDPEIKTEALWIGEMLSRHNIVAERRPRLPRARERERGMARRAWRVVLARQHDDPPRRRQRRARVTVAARAYPWLALLRRPAHRSRGAGAASPCRHLDAGAGERRRRPRRGDPGDFRDRRRRGAERHHRRCVRWCYPGGR